MAATSRMNRDLQQKMDKKMATEKMSLLEKLQCACLRRGANGIKGLGR